MLSKIWYLAYVEKPPMDIIQTREKTYSTSYGTIEKLE